MSAVASCRAGEDSVWQENTYQQTSEKRGYDDGGHGNWQLVGHTPSIAKPHVPDPLPASGTAPVLPVPAKPVGSLLALYSAKEKSKASSCHIEFAGRSYGKMKADLYPQMR